jgi:A/G-specific adenine glycosylase
MPWKGEKDPYKIWLSEIILQQTRVEQGTEYYKKFITRFPGIRQLAAAKDSEIFKMWEGLGYYTRCRNLISTARLISKKRNGKFPDTYEQILELNGIGSYTAAAISSFAFNLPYAVVDGNVYRVFSRIFGIRKPIDTAGGKKIFSELANELLDKKNPGIYNQALMDFGAVVCKPFNPACSDCVFKKYCYAFNKELISNLPVKEKKKIIRHRWFNYIVVRYRGRVYIRSRAGKDIWKNLHEFLLVESTNQLTVTAIINNACKLKMLEKGSFTIQSASPVFHQILSHQKISCRFIEVKLKHPARLAGIKAVSASQFSRLAFPKIINEFIRSGKKFLK